LGSTLHQAFDGRDHIVDAAHGLEVFRIDPTPGELLQFDDQIQADFQNARETGGQGTPWSILIGPDGEKFPINGAQPLGAVRALIENVSQ
jgi:hypothetical protein